MTRTFVTISLASCLALVACGSDGSLFLDKSASGAGGSSSGNFGGGDGSGDGSGDGDGDGGACASAVAQTTKPKVDIIFVIDNSGSMTGEMAQIQANVNTFAAKIGGSGLDYQVIFIVRKTGSGNKICVPEPLAKPSCMDNPPLFHHLDVNVQSHNVFKAILGSYDFDATIAWGKHARSDAFKVFVGVSDDGRNDLETTEFDEALLAKGADQFGTAEDRRYVFHAICGWQEGTSPPSSSKCSTADGNGIKYQEAALLTGGIIESVCKTDYSSVLDKIGDGIIERLACELGYPTAEAADPTKVQVRLTTAGDAPQTLVQVTDASKCDANPTGWYYDEPSEPTKIVLCKSTCDVANKAPGSKVEALVGCKSADPK